MTAQQEDRTVLAMSATDRLFVTIGLPLLGLVLSVGLPPLARWALDQDTALPVRPAWWVAAWPDRPWRIVVAVALGLLLGFGMAMAAIRGSARVTVGDGGLRVDVDDRTQRIDRSEVAGIFLDGKKLTVFDHESKYLAVQALDCPRERTEQAMLAHGYPWHPADPYADLFRRWEPESDGLPAEVNSVLRARESALKKKAYRESRELHDVVATFGFVVRDDGTRQFWRPLVRS